MGQGFAYDEVATAWLRIELAGVKQHQDLTDLDPAGQDLRSIPGVYETFVNQYQKDLVVVYDSWSAETARLMSLSDVSAARAQVTFERRLSELSIDLKVLGRQRISEASGLGLGEILGKRASSPQVVETVTRLISQNDAFIDESLIPSIRDRFAADASRIASLPVDQREVASLESMSKRRAAVARGAGGAQVAIFDTQQAAGMAENEARMEAGERAIAVRWVLDTSAEHCQDDPKRGTFGCPSLARTYPRGWAALPTVPAGNVSCLGNCRCSLEADFAGSGDWNRIT